MVSSTSKSMVKVPAKPAVAAPRKTSARLPALANMPLFALTLIYMMLTIIRPQDYMPGLVGVPLLSGVLMLALLFWLGSDAKQLDAPQSILLPAFLVALMLSEVANHWIGGALEQIMHFGPSVAAFFIVSTSVGGSRKRVRLTMALFALCSLVLAWHGVGQSQTGVGWTGMTPSEDGRIQYVGIFNDPNDLGLLFVTALPMTLYLSGGATFLLRLGWWAGAGLLLYAIYLTNSRGAMLAVMTMVGVYVWRKRGLVTAGVLSGGGLMLLMLLPSRLQDLDPEESSAFGRVDAWYEGLHMFLSNPLFGVGAGNFTDYNELTAHNSLVLVIAETGLLGYVIWLAFVCYGFAMMLALIRHELPVVQSTPIADLPAASRRAQTQARNEQAAAWAQEKALALTLLLSMSSMFAAAFFLSRSYMIVLYIVAALVMGLYQGARQRYPSLPPFRLAKDGWRWIPLALGSIVGLFLLVTLLMHGQ